MWIKWSLVWFPAWSLSGNYCRQAVHTHVPLLPSGINWYQRKLGGKQTTTRHTGTVSVVVLLFWCLASGNESEISASPTGSGPWMTLVTLTGKGNCIAVMEHHVTATECHLPYGITQCYLLPDSSERTPLHPSQSGWYSIYLPRRGRRLSWARWLVTYRDGLPAHRRPPIQVLTGPNVD